jgi:hypothetical protein
MDIYFHISVKVHSTTLLRRPNGRNTKFYKERYMLGNLKYIMKKRVLIVLSNRPRRDFPVRAILRVKFKTTIGSWVYFGQKATCE